MLTAQIDETCEQLDSLRAIATSPRTSKLKTTPTGKSPSTSQVENLTVRIDDLERRLQGLREEKAIAMLDVTAAIGERVTGKAATVLFRHYVNGESFSEIAAEMNLSASQVSRLHCSGVRAFNVLHDWRNAANEAEERSFFSKGLL